MKHLDALASVLLDIQRRHDDRPPMPETVRELHREMRDALRSWSDDGLLANEPADAFRFINRSSTADGAVVLEVCGVNFERDPTQRHFRRDDGAWFDFRMTVRERRGRPLELLAYGFEIRFQPQHGGPAWIRFDLNPPGHDNDARGIRSHMHPATDDWSVPAPSLSPIEVLHLLVVGLRSRSPGHPRSPTEAA